MKVNTALGFIAAGLALLARARGHRQGRSWSQGLALLLVWLGGLRLLGSSTGIDLGLDEWLFHDDGAMHGSMAPLTALNFILTGLAILGLGTRWGRRWPSEWLASALGLLALMALLANFYDAAPPYFALAFSNVAIHTSLGFMACSLAILLAEPRHSFAAVLVDGGPGGVLARRLLPASLALPALLGWIILEGVSLGHFSADFALTLLVLTCILCGASFSLWAALATKRAGYALNKEQERLRVTLQSIGDGVIAVDLDGRVTLVNRIAEKLMGWQQEEAIGLPLAVVFRIHKEGSLEPMESPVERALREDKAFELKQPFLLISRSGTEVLIADSTSPIHDAEDRMIGAVLVFRDVTAKQRADKELLNLQKLESLAVIAGGIAHDFNNILTIVLANVSLAGEEKGLQQAEYLRDAEAAVMRGSQLANQLMAFSKGNASVHGAVSLRELIRQAAKFALTGASTRAEFDLQAGPDVVDADASQISQVIQNLVLNAAQAMPSGGLVRISMQAVAVARGSELALAPGSYYKVAVLDEGHGMAPEVLRRVFDPFFTTKPKGNGLGLASAHSIAKSHQGLLMAESEPGQGSVFSLYLPVFQQSAPLASRKAVRATPGRGRVLVMDDDVSILKVTLSMLRSLGYRAQGSADGKAAIALIEQGLAAGDPFDAAILDLTIPGAMGGKEAVQKMLAIQPGLQAIVASGYSVDPVMNQHIEHGFAAAMPKPYDLHKMGALLSALIGA